MDRHIGDVPMMDMVTGRAHLVISLGVGQVQDLSDEHAAVAEKFATAARVLADELRDLVTAKEHEDWPDRKEASGHPVSSARSTAAAGSGGPRYGGGVTGGLNLRSL